MTMKRFAALDYAAPLGVDVVAASDDLLDLFAAVAVRVGLEDALLALLPLTERGRRLAALEAAAVEYRAAQDEVTRGILAGLDSRMAGYERQGRALVALCEALPPGGGVVVVSAGPAVAPPGDPGEPDVVVWQEEYGGGG
jgi:hypothetical protein